VALEPEQGFQKFSRAKHVFYFFKLPIGLAFIELVSESGLISVGSVIKTCCIGVN
jgi:hypothetical protein